MITMWSKKFLINGREFCGRKDKGKVYVPYSEEIEIDINDVFYEKTKSKEMELRVLDIKDYKKISGLMDTFHENYVELEVENLTLTKNNINSQVVNIHNSNLSNTQIINNELVERNNKDVKNRVFKVLENPTVAGIIGAVVAGVVGLLLKNK